MLTCGDINFPYVDFFGSGENVRITSYPSGELDVEVISTETGELTRFNHFANIDEFILAWLSRTEVAT